MDTFSETITEDLTDKEFGDEDKSPTVPTSNAYMKQMAKDGFKGKRNTKDLQYKLRLSRSLK